MKRETPCGVVKSESLPRQSGRRPGVVAEALRIGLRSMRANRLPVVVLWGLAAMLALCYWKVPGVRGAVAPLHEALVLHPWTGAFLTQLFFIGFLPWAFYMVVRGIRRRRSALTCALQVLWGCLTGCLCMWFFRFQDATFGPSDSFAVVLKKTLIDQFVWTVLLAPPTATFFFWLGRDMSLAACRRDWPGRRFLSAVVLPNLLMNWFVAIPTTLSVYTLPAELRLIVCGLVGSAWMLLGVRIGEESSRT